MSEKRANFLGLAAKLRRDTEGSAQTPSEFLVREDREHGHRVVASHDDLHAPRLMASEIANALWRKVRLGEVERGRVGALVAAVRQMPIHWNTDETFCADAIRLALALDRPVYDCVYLALAHRIGAQVVTADVRFANALAPTEHGDSVMTLADYVRMQS